MSKVREWLQRVREVRAAAPDEFRSDGLRAYPTDFGYIVLERMMRADHWGTTSGGDYKTPSPLPASIQLRADEAVKLARWIIDNVADDDHAERAPEAASNAGKTEGAR